MAQQTINHLKTNLLDAFAQAGATLRESSPGAAVAATTHQLLAALAEFRASAS